MIQSVYIGDDANLVEIILSLHAPGGKPMRVLDATFGHGGFWRGRPRERIIDEIVGLDRRLLTDDLSLARSGAIETLIAGDYENLPFGHNTFDVVLFDPPFLTRGGKDSVMTQRYTAFETYEHLKLSLERARDEFAWILKPKGFVVVKCMDWTEGRRRRWMHIDLVNLWITRYRLDDLIVKVATQNMRNPGWTHQDRSKAAHVYFMVFRPLKSPQDPAGTNNGYRRKANARKALVGRRSQTLVDVHERIEEGAQCKTKQGTLNI